MAIIYSYPPSGGILATDTLVGTSTVIVGGRTKNQTKSFSIGSLASYINTSVGNDLTQVLTNGNTSLLDAKVGELYLYDVTEQEYGKVKLYDSQFNFYNNLGANITSLSKDGVVFFPNTYNAQLVATTITGNRQYQLPNASGTIALTGDFVPYIGATQAVNLGAFDLTVNSITIGRGAGNDIENTILGFASLTDNTTGYGLAGFGVSVFGKNTTGRRSSAFGNYALFRNITGQNNTAIGYGSLPYNDSGYSNTAVGTWSLFYNESGAKNVSIGESSGVWTADGTTPITIANDSIFLGANTKALQDDSTNEVVIGAGATGYGSNTVTLGNTNIANTILRGKVGIGTIAPNNLLDVVKNQPEPTRINIENIDAAGTSTIRFTNLTGAAAALFENSTNQFTFQNATNGGNVRFQTTNMLGATLTALIADSDQSVGVGVTIIEKTAKLQVDSNSKGFLPPRMTSLEREDIVSPANGLIVYDTTLKTFCGYADNGWKTFSLDII
jgi:hypothetical protein